MEKLHLGENKELAKSHQAIKDTEQGFGPKGIWAQSYL